MCYVNIICTCMLSLILFNCNETEIIAENLVFYKDDNSDFFVETNVGFNDTLIPASDEKAFYADLSDSEIKELKLMDSLMNEFDNNTSEYHLNDQKLDDLFQVDVQKVADADLSKWQSVPDNTFKKTQRSFPNVREVYQDNETYVKKLLLANNINSYNIDLFFRAFKKEGEMEIWAKNKKDDTYSLLLTFPFFQGISELGPKKREGDLQVPEGFYFIDYFNPLSDFKVSMRINYPNKSDSIRNAKEKYMGGAICIHGTTVSVGCLAITNNRIPTAYLLASEAKDKGQQNIPVHIFPCRMNLQKSNELFVEYTKQTDLLARWKPMIPIYEYFENNHKIPQISCNNYGFYTFNPAEG
jgi:murein L,D-transpeptidase YafK